MSEKLLEEVQSKYASIASSSLSSEHAGVRAVAEAFGYTPEELAALPAEANMGLSCGNPTAFAGLRAGETVVDLGCGGGLDVLLAAAKVGPTGRAIGIDMTPEMIERARKNAAMPALGQVRGNVKFQLATIDRLPLPDGSVDCLISNCVINLAPDKHAVFHEMHRVLMMDTTSHNALRILVVEDDADTAHTMATVLRDHWAGDDMEACRC